MKISYVRLGWVRAEIIEQHKGITVQALDKRRNRGKFIEGQHWKKVHGVIMYHYENIDQLFEEFNESVA
ncbi:excisionase family protein [Salinimonas marina]|uniref:Excisionase family protein n=1 Tax=Salinimonas marina TaxID=2785918 RepID=A0A7S9DZQ7_9ALTE|nr:excisionase family protein [Salinimonas marina]QPG06924.1 excisionase family protein [Salinimonas marina]